MQSIYSMVSIKLTVSTSANFDDVKRLISKVGAEMASDEERENEALEWAEITFKDAIHETR